MGFFEFCAELGILLFQSSDDEIDVFLEETALVTDTHIAEGLRVQYADHIRDDQQCEEDT